MIKRDYFIAYKSSSEKSTVDGYMIFTVNSFLPERPSKIASEGLKIISKREGFKQCTITSFNRIK